MQMIERRGSVGPIPEVPEFYLSPQQLQRIKIFRKFGWELFCVRRHSQANTITILKNAKDNSYRVLSGSGILNLKADIPIRDS